MEKPERELQTETMEKRLGQMKSGVIELCETISQVKKVLCGNEKATNEELLQAASQLKSRLAQVERERDAAIADLKLYAGCKVCKHGDFKFPKECMDCGDETNYWQWRGVCPENTKEELT